MAAFTFAERGFGIDCSVPAVSVKWILNFFYRCFLQCRPKMGEFGRRWKTRDSDPSGCDAEVRRREIKCDKIGEKAVLLFSVLCSTN
jgi:hypothetical protein